MPKSITPIYSPHWECASKEFLRNWQITKINGFLFRLKTQGSSFYKNLIKNYKIEKLEDLQDFPFTTKQNLRDQYPYGMLCEGIKIKRIHSSSGSTGQPTLSIYSKKDLELWSNLMARVLTAAGMDQNDDIFNSFGYGLFTGGLGFQSGCDKLNLFTIPAGNADPYLQLKLLNDLEATILLATPTGANLLLEVAKEYQRFPGFIGKIILGGESWGENLRKKIELFFSCRTYDTYGTSEIIGPGIGFECQYQCGLHINEDFFPEIIDPITLKNLPNGEFGELVITALTKEAMPLLRYRTGDITRLLDGQCECGRTLIRMDRVRKRIEHSIFGSELSLVDIEDKLIDLGAEPHYLVNSEKLTLEFEVGKDASISLRNRIESSLSKWLKLQTNKKIQVTSLEFKSLPRTMGKANHFA